MLAFYILAAVVGGGLIVISALGGLGGHGDVDHAGADHDLDHHGVETSKDHPTDMGDSWIPFISLRFWTYFFGVMGLCGLLLTLFRASAEPTTGILSGVAGLACGIGAFSFYRWAKKTEPDSQVREQDMLGNEANLVVAVRPGQLGKVRMTVRGEIIDMLAASHDGTEIEAGTDVVVVGIEGNQAQIVRRTDILN